MNNEYGYSIVVLQHFKYKRKGSGYGIVIGTKSENIYASIRDTQICKEKHEAVYEMTERIKIMTLPKYGEDGV